MKIVIDIDNEAYGRIQALVNADYFEHDICGYSMQRIANGTPYEERPKGEWIVGEYMDCHSDILPEYTCPFCGEVAYRKYDFCHCGADMRKETENDT